MLSASCCCTSPKPGPLPGRAQCSLCMQPVQQQHETGVCSHHIRLIHIKLWQVAADGANPTVS